MWKWWILCNNSKGLYYWNNRDNISIRCRDHLTTKHVNQFFIELFSFPSPVHTTQINRQTTHVYFLYHSIVQHGVICASFPELVRAKFTMQWPGIHGCSEQLSYSHTPVAFKISRNDVMARVCHRMVNNCTTRTVQLTSRLSETVGKQEPVSTFFSIRRTGQSELEKWMLCVCVYLILHYLFNLSKWVEKIL